MFNATRSFLNLAALAVMLTLACFPAFAQVDYVEVSPAACVMTAATTAFTSGPGLARQAAGNVVLTATTNTTAGTVTVTCDLASVGRMTKAKIREIQVNYGVQTTAMSSIAAALVNSVTMPAPGSAATGTVAAFGGSLTVLPASLQLTTTSAGACFTESLVLGTPAALGQRQKLSVEQVFTTAGTTATILQICGIRVYFNSGF